MSLKAKGSITIKIIALALLLSGAGQMTQAAESAGQLVAAKKAIAAHQNASAIAMLKAELARTPDSAEAHLLLGQLYASAKTYDQAKLHLRQALKLSRGNAIGQKANLALLALPKNVTKPKTGMETRMIASMLGLGRSRGTASRPTVIDFYASWCQPCKQLDSVIGRYKTSLGDKVTFMRVDVDDPNSQTLLDQYEVSPIPTVVYLDDQGEVVTYSVGFSGENTVKDGINKILSAKTP